MKISNSTIILKDEAYSLKNCEKLNAPFCISRYCCAENFDESGMVCVQYDECREAMESLKFISEIRKLGVTIEDFKNLINLGDADVTLNNHYFGGRSQSPQREHITFKRIGYEEEKS